MLLDDGSESYEDELFFVERRLVFTVTTFSVLLAIIWTTKKRNFIYAERITSSLSFLDLLSILLRLSLDLPKRE